MRVKYGIELSWSHGGYSGEIDIEDADLAGLTADEATCRIEEMVGDAVANEVSWGWEVVSDA